MSDMTDTADMEAAIITAAATTIPAGGTVVGATGDRDTLLVLILAEADAGRAVAWIVEARLLAVAAIWAAQGVDPAAGFPEEAAVRTGGQAAA
ncbi:hypothetical protein NBRC3257_1899 [Gluconobacter thailandicus NBRC 3257]|uniref:Uncharacterized protein n=1 Tax=Gluconobacter thailandicus NBRC 3257 TaxID=1381097 RepID=A0ABQ0IXG8_GLUTH|nr:hypothetical protein NBRC3257_1899 [Gluconobacter thailandicus NBRC 3257]